MFFIFLNIFMIKKCNKNGSNKYDISKYAISKIYKLFF